MGRAGATGFRIVVHAGAWLPLAWLAWRFTQDDLTANPIKEIQLETGRIALSLLLLSLACTPVYRVSGFIPVLQTRRTLGLYSFLYVSLHFFNFLGVDYGFNYPLILAAVAGKLFPLAGLAAFIILVPIAITSSRRWADRPGKNWQRLHRLVYAAAVLSVIHYLWAVKSPADIMIPLIYAAVLAILLIMRLPVVKNSLRSNTRSPEP